MISAGVLSSAFNFLITVIINEVNNAHFNCHLKKVGQGQGEVT